MPKGTSLHLPGIEAVRSGGIMRHTSLPSLAEGRWLTLTTIRSDGLSGRTADRL